LPGKSITLIIGASEDKDISGIFDALLPLVKKAILTKSSHPRAMDVNLMMDIASSYSCPVESLHQLKKQSLKPFIKPQRTMLSSAREAFSSPLQFGMSFLRNNNGLVERHGKRSMEWKKEDSEDYTSSLYQRTEELYQTPNAEVNSNGYLELPGIILDDIVVFPKMVSPIFLSKGENLDSIQEAQNSFRTLISLFQKSR